MVSADLQKSGLHYARRLSYALILLCLVILMGSIGYVVVEGWDFLDAFYMTVITIATVGYEETHQLSQSGKLFTIALIIIGVGTTGYALGSLTQLLVGLQIAETFGRRRVEKEIEKLKNHYIVCGYGRMGKIVCRELRAKGKTLVVVEKEDSFREDIEAEGFLYILGDVTDEEVLQKAGVERARSLVAALKTDADNLYLTMTARQINPALYIVSRVAEEGVEKKFLRAGSNQVVNPYHIGGLKMAHAILRPVVVDFLDLTEKEQGMGVRMEGIQAMSGSAVINKTLGEAHIREKLGINIVALKRSGGEIETNLSGDTRIVAGDVLVAVGSEEALHKLEEMLNSSPIV